jgi:hypothetical protein
MAKNIKYSENAELTNASDQLLRKSEELIEQSRKLLERSGSLRNKCQNGSGQPVELRPRVGAVWSIG